MTMSKASKEYNIPIGTISHKINGKNFKNPGGQTVFTNEEEECFVEHILAVAQWGFPFDLLDIRMLVKRYIEQKGITITKFVNNTPGVEWARLFVKRHKDKLVTRTCQNWPCWHNT